MNPIICLSCECEPACAFSLDPQVSGFTMACQTAQVLYELQDLDGLVHELHDNSSK